MSAVGSTWDPVRSPGPDPCQASVTKELSERNKAFFLLHKTDAATAGGATARDLVQHLVN